MLASVFFSQPLGQLLAILVALVVVRLSKGGIPIHHDSCQLSEDFSQMYVEPVELENLSSQQASLKPPALLISS